MLELASGSLVPRPTTTSKVSARSTPSFGAPRHDAVGRGRRAASGRSPRSRPKRTSIAGLSAAKLLTSQGRSFLTWLAANSMPGHREDSPRAARRQRGERRRGSSAGRIRDSRWRNRLPADAGAAPAASSSNSPIASGSRLPWPQSRTAVCRHRLTPSPPAAESAAAMIPVVADPLLLLAAGLAIDALVRRHAGVVRPHSAPGRARRPRRRFLRPQAQP